MKEFVKNSKRIGLLVSLSMCAPAFALAATPKRTLEEVRVSVSYADLNLGHAAGIENLYQRLRSAASKACGPASLREAGSLMMLRARQECYKELVDEAVVKVDNASLTKRHSG